ncbi:hypothetical protein SanaruYs_16560 [Chryseotalea sanaruensis]|uniref:Uncharacterized protein n=1 Tax=Chryseotalea sanaruensis TaxID=2482724 RepID=A0A401U965_9BACT|nr:hypothetical protein [Chryseotalea sanaruensis]GCC51431.1 hypothetical protein SanaruYs_16560 [Chryseotalea sanaruensis]
MTKSFTTANILSCCLIVFVCFCCEQKEKPQCVLPKNALDTVSIDSAYVSINRYSELAKKHFGKVPIVSYTIPGIDLLQAMGYSLPKVNSITRDTLAVRVYLGVSADSTFKLFISAVRGASFCKNEPGVDVPLYKKKRFSDDISGEGYVLDFTMPCPATCGNSIFHNTND